ncbi:hypothetical protein [Ideonella sp. A 288]|uniref:hypothetical protein n=1 Tax=Ideonella sp. A 288 TaxID=1962181 RepID=UPI00118674C8|nr:hypothetical protein [Ideonella sp. A 288]
MEELSARLIAMNGALAPDSPHRNTLRAIAERFNALSADTVRVRAGVRPGHGIAPLAARRNQITTDLDALDALMTA